MKDEKHHKVRDHCHYTGEYRGATRSTGNLEQSVPKEIPIPFHKGCNYDDHFIIKELAEEFKEQFTCLEENTEKYITSTVPMEKEVTGIYKNREELQKIYLTYCNLLIAEDLWKAHYQILSIIFLRKLIKLKVNTGTMMKMWNLWNHVQSMRLFSWTEFLMEEYKCLCCNKNYKQKFDEKLKVENWFFNTYKYSYHDSNKFIFLLQKGFYLYEYMDDWTKINETSLPEKEDFYNHLNMEDITAADYTHAKMFENISKSLKIYSFSLRFWISMARSFRKDEIFYLR